MTEQARQASGDTATGATRVAAVSGRLRTSRVAIVRALRVTVVACVGFYLGRFVLHSPALATYALFGAIALGALAQLPGGARRRAVTLLTALPVGALLVCVGTLTAIHTATAVAGMAVVGFAISYAGVGGP